MRTALVIDDDAVFRHVVRSEFSERGWRTLEAEDGEQGLEMASRHQPDLVVCDLMMPRINGFSVCRRIRGDRLGFPATHIIVITGSTFSSDRENALEAGAEAVMEKPFKLSQLVEAANRLVSAPPIEPARRLFSAEGEVMVRFWGVRGSIPTPGPATVGFGGNTSCVEIRAGENILVLDSGTGIRGLGMHLAKEFSGKPLELTLLITHTHWDHIQGFPFFPCAYNPANRIQLLAFEGARRNIEATLSGQMESPYFPITMQQMPGNIVVKELRNMQFNVGNLLVSAIHTNHPGVCVGYKITTPNGSIAYIPDNELYHPGSKLPRTNGVGPEAATEFAIARDKRVEDFIRDAEIVIMDAQYDSEEYPRYVGWGHSCIEDTVRIAGRAGVKRLFLFHHDPSHDDFKVAAIEEAARKQAKSEGWKVEVEAAREGAVATIAAKL